MDRLKNIHSNSQLQLQTMENKINEIISRQDKLEECVKYLAAEMYLLGLGEEGRNYSDKINQILSE